MQGFFSLQGTKPGVRNRTSNAGPGCSKADYVFNFLVTVSFAYFCFSRLNISLEQHLGVENKTRFKTWLLNNWPRMISC